LAAFFDVKNRVMALARNPHKKYQPHARPKIIQKLGCATMSVQLPSTCTTVIETKAIGIETTALIMADQIRFFRAFGGIRQK